MIQINLLPWREQLRQDKKLLFLKRALFALGLTLLFLIILHFYHLSLIHNQQFLDNYLQSEIDQNQLLLNQLNSQKVEKNSLEAQLHFIANIYEKNYKVVRLLNELIKLIPNNISIEKINRKDNKITFAGRASSDAEITQFIQRLARSPIFEHPELTSINIENNSSKKYFEMETIQKG